MKKFVLLINISLLCLLLVALNVLNSRFLSGIQFDLSENKVYTLSDGSKSILTALDEPIDLYYFFSDSATKGMTSIRNYAQRVERMLKTYEALSNGMIRLHLIDPEPFSESEDDANQYGLTGISVSTHAQPIYFGLAGTNLLDGQVVIPFFNPNDERFLEYELSKRVYELSDASKPTIGVISDLPLLGGPNPFTGQYTPAMTFFNQLQQFYELTMISAQDTALPDEIDMLMLVHPQNINDDLLQAIDRHIMTTGKLIAFVDPYFESDPNGAATGIASDMRALSQYGIQVEESKLVFDPQLGLDIQGQQGQIVNHPGMLGLTPTQISNDDVITRDLESINMASVGFIDTSQGSDWHVSPLLTSSDFGQAIAKDQVVNIQDPQGFSRLLTQNATTYTLGARISGIVKSAYMEDVSSRVNVLVYADVDMLTDRFWVQHNQFFGQTISTPFANNGDVVINSVDNLSGSTDLIGIRSRGTYSRPFTRVAELEASADAKFREQEQRLQSELEQVEQQLIQLQTTEQSEFVTPQQQAAIDSFIERKVEIRQALRRVRLQLQQDIASLGNKLKLLNILIFPVLITVLLSLFYRLFKTRPPRKLIALVTQKEPV